MRLPTALSFRAALSLRTAVPAAALALAPALYGVGVPATAAEPAPACGDETAADFPIETRLRGGPDHYARGAGWQQWHLELRNTTDTGCRAVHPVAVLVDQGHALRPRQIQFEFLDPSADGGTWRPVSFQTTDEDENIGVFEKDFKGFTVEAGKTVDVRIRSRFTTDAPLGPVTANAIAVQRREDDGDWVGQSNDYAFRIDAAAEPGADDDASGVDHAPEPSAEPEPELKPEPSAEPESEPESELEREPSAELESEPDAELELDRAASAEPTPAPSPTRRLERSPVAVPPSPESETDQGTEDLADSGTDEDLGVETDLGTGTDEAGTDATDTEADPGTDTSAETGTDTDADTGTGTETGSDTETGTETGTDPGTETGTGTDPGYETGTETPPATDPGTETGGTDEGGTDGREDGHEQDEEGDTNDEDGTRRPEHWKPELAATGQNVRLAGLGVISVGLVAGGAALVVKSRRARR